MLVSMCYRQSSWRGRRCVTREISRRREISFSVSTRDLPSGSQAAKYRMTARWRECRDHCATCRSDCKTSGLAANESQRQSALLAMICMDSRYIHATQNNLSIGFRLCIDLRAHMRLGSLKFYGICPFENAIFSFTLLVEI